MTCLLVKTDFRRFCLFLYRKAVGKQGSVFMKHKNTRCNFTKWKSRDGHVLAHVTYKRLTLVALHKKKMNDFCRHLIVFIFFDLPHLFLFSKNRGLNHSIRKMSDSLDLDELDDLDGMWTFVTCDCLMCLKYGLIHVIIGKVEP